MKSTLLNLTYVFFFLFTLTSFRHAQYTAAHTHTHTHTHVHVRVHRFISKKVYTIQFVNRISKAKEHVVIRCTVDYWEYEHSKLIGSVQDVFIFKQEVNSRVMQSIRLETNWKAIQRDLLNCPSVGHTFRT